MCVIKGWYKADYTEAPKRIDSVIETRWELRVGILGNHFQLANSFCVSMPNAFAFGMIYKTLLQQNDLN